MKKTYSMKDFCIKRQGLVGSKYHLLYYMDKFIANIRYNATFGYFQILHYSHTSEWDNSRELSREFSRQLSLSKELTSLRTGWSTKEQSWVEYQVSDPDKILAEDLGYSFHD